MLLFSENLLQFFTCLTEIPLLLGSVSRGLYTVKY
jgi:hypothetical protein